MSRVPKCIQNTIRIHAESMALGEVLSYWSDQYSYADMENMDVEVFQQAIDNEEILVYELYEDYDADDVWSKISSYKDQFTRQLTDFYKAL